MACVDINGYADELRRELLTAAAVGGEALVEAVERLVPAFDAAVRMSILEALADAAAEISAELPSGSVELRLRGRQPEFVVTAASSDDVPLGGPGDGPADDEPFDADEAATARITLRLPEALKQRAEDAAARSRRSTNTWLVEVIRTAVSGPDADRRRGDKHLSGWVR